MSGKRTYPGLGLVSNWPYGTDNWNTEMDANLARLSAVSGFISAQSRAVGVGNWDKTKIYIVPSNAAANANAIAIWNNDPVVADQAWIYITPKDGWTALVVDELVMVTFTGGGWGVPDVTQKNWTRRFTGNGVGINTTSAVTVAQLGRWFSLSAANITVTLPNADTALAGGTYIFLNRSGGSITLAGGGSLFQGPSGFSSATLVLGPNEWVETTAQAGATQWYITGRGLMEQAASAAALASLGNQMLDVGGQNLLYNSAFRKSTLTAGLGDGWSIDGGGNPGTGVYSIVASPLCSQEFAQRIDVTGIAATSRGIFISGSRRVPLVEGQAVSASALFRATAGMSVRLFLRPLNAAGATLGGQVQVPVTTTGGIQRVTGTILSLPAGTASVDIYLRLTGATGIGDGFVEFLRPKISVGATADGWTEDDIVAREEVAALGNTKAPLASPSFTGGATFAGNLTVNDGNLTVRTTTGSPMLNVDASAGNQRALSLRTSNLERWRMGASSASETGANAGSDFFISRYGDDGAGISTPVAISRTNAMVTLAQLTVNGPTLLLGPGRLGAYTLTTLPNAATYANYLIIVTNAAGGSKVCWSNGTNWCLLNTSTVVS